MSSASEVYVTQRVSSSPQVRKLSIPPVVGQALGFDGNKNLTTISVNTSVGGYNVFNVKSAPYAATGNSSTDDTAAIQSAINACDAAGGGVVYLPNGTYKTTGLILGSGSGSHISLIGESLGGTTIRYLSSDSSGIALKFNVNNYSRFANFQLANISSTRGTTEGIQFTGPTPNIGTVNYGNNFSDIIITNFHYGWHPGDTTGTVGSECTAINMTLGSCDKGFFNNDEGNAFNFNFINLATNACTVGIEGYSVFVYGGSSSGNTTDYVLSKHGVVSNFRSENAGTFLVTNPDSMVITNCRVEGLTGGTAVQITSGTIGFYGCAIDGKIVCIGGVLLNLNNVEIVDTTPIRVGSGGATVTYNFQGVYLTNSSFSPQTALNKQGVFTGNSDPGTFSDYSNSGTGSTLAIANAVSPTVGLVTTITDSSTNTLGATISGSGSNKVLAWFNGTNWTVIGK